MWKRKQTQKTLIHIVIAPNKKGTRFYRMPFSIAKAKV